MSGLQQAPIKWLFFDVIVDKLNRNRMMIYLPRELLKMWFLEFIHLKSKKQGCKDFSISTYQSM